MKENISREVESDLGYDENTHLLTKNQKRAVAMGLVMSALSGPIVGQVSAESSTDLSSTTITEAGKMPSREPLFGGGEVSVSTEVGAAYKFGWFGESPLVPLTEARKLEVSAIIENVSLSKDQIPIEEVQRAMKVLEAERLAVYDKQLIEYGCTNPEMRKVCSGWMLFVENSPFQIININGERTQDDVKNYITTQQIMDFSISGKGLNAAYDNDEFPRILLGNMDDKKLRSHFDKAIDFLEGVSGDDVIKFLWDNGTNVFFPIKWDKRLDATVCAGYPNGGILPNIDSADSKIPKLWLSMVRGLMGEVYFFNHSDLIRSFSIRTNGGYIEMVKVWLASYNLAYLYNESEKKNNDLKFICSDLKNTIGYWSQVYGVLVNDPFLLRQMEMIMDNNMAKPLGVENWDFVKEGLGEIK